MLICAHSSSNSKKSPEKVIRELWINKIVCVGLYPCLRKLLIMGCYLPFFWRPCFVKQIFLIFFEKQFSDVILTDRLRYDYSMTLSNHLQRRPSNLCSSYTCIGTSSSWLVIYLPFEARICWILHRVSLMYRSICLQMHSWVLLNWHIPGYLYFLTCMTNFLM